VKKPIILTVDDDREVLRTIAGDLRRQYGARYRVIPVDSGDRALSLLREVKLANDPVALLLVDQRMPGMTGVELLAEASPIFPDARRVLLTAYADTDVAIRAINEVQLHHYLLKPWDPPEQQLYPVLDDVLDDWQATYIPPFEGIRIIGHRWSAAAFDTRSFLSRNLIPYQWLDVERDDEAAALLAHAGVEDGVLPVLVFPDGEVLVQPTPLQIASKIGARTRAELPFYDLIIVGGGPAGLAAAVYGASEGLKTLVIEREAPGGQAGTSSRIENYLGFPSGLSGADLTRRGVAQAQRLGAEFLTSEVTSVCVDGNYRIVDLADGNKLSCSALLVATGVQYRRLDMPGVERLTGAGVYYGGALSEAVGLQGDDVYIAGGANRPVRRRSTSPGTPARSRWSCAARTSPAACHSISSTRSRARQTSASGCGQTSSRRSATIIWRPCGSAVRIAAWWRPSRLRHCSSSSGRSRIPNGSRTSWRSTRRGTWRAAPTSSGCARCRQRGRSGGSPSGWRPACRASSSPGMCAIARSSASPRRPARARWRFTSSTSTSAASSALSPGIVTK